MTSYIVPLADLKNYLNNELYDHIKKIITNYDEYYVCEVSAGIYNYIFISDIIYLNKTFGKEIIFVLDKVFLTFAQKMVVQEDKTIKVYSYLKFNCVNENFDYLIFYFDNIKLIINKSSIKLQDLQ